MKKIICLLLVLILNIAGCSYFKTDNLHNNDSDKDTQFQSNNNNDTQFQSNNNDIQSNSNSAEEIEQNRNLNDVGEIDIEIDINIVELSDNDFYISDTIDIIMLGTKYSDFVTQKKEIATSYVGEKRSQNNIIYKYYQHSYDDFDLYTSNINYDIKNRSFDEYYISQLTIKTANVKTAREIKIGDSKDDVLERYGLSKVNSDDNSSLTYQLDEKNLTFVFNANNEVNSIILSITVIDDKVTNFNDEEEINNNSNKTDFIRRSYNILSESAGRNVVTIGVDKEFNQIISYDSIENDINIIGEIVSISNDKRYVAYTNDTIKKTVILDVFTNESFEISLTTAFTWFEDSSGFCYVPAYESSQNRIFMEKFESNGRVISEYILSRHMSNGNYIINLEYDQVNNCIFYNIGYFGDVKYDKNQVIDINELTLKSTYSFMIECDGQSYKFEILEDGNMIFINYLDGYIFCIPSEWKDKYEIYVGSSNAPIHLSYEFPYNGHYSHQRFGDIYIYDAVESIGLISYVYNNEFNNTHITIQKPLDVIPNIGQYIDEYFELWDMLFDEKNEFYGFIIGESPEKAIEEAREYFK